MKHILCTDDEPWTIAGEVERLELGDFKVRLVSSVSSALRAIDETPHFDAIVIDVINRRNALEETPDIRIPAEVPDRTLGITLGRMIRAKAALRAVPMIFYTVVNDTSVRTQVAELPGPCWHLSKRDSLAKKVRALFEGVQV